MIEINNVKDIRSMQNDCEEICAIASVPILKRILSNVGAHLTYLVLLQAEPHRKFRVGPNALKLLCAIPKIDYVSKYYLAPEDEIAFVCTRLIDDNMLVDNYGTMMHFETFHKLNRMKKWDVSQMASTCVLKCDDVIGALVDAMKDQQQITVCFRRSSLYDPMLPLLVDLLDHSIIVKIELSDENLHRTNLCGKLQHRAMIDIGLKNVDICELSSSEKETSRNEMIEMLAKEDVVLSKMFGVLSF